MNCIILFQHELVSETEAVVSGERAKYLHEWHDLKEGLIIRGGIWGGGFGKVEVKRCEKERIEIALSINEPPISKDPIGCIVAVPRPQTVKKVIQSAVSFGMQVVHFVKTANVVPSYLSSHALRPEGIQIETLKAMEQVCDSTPLEVVIHSKWHIFAREVLPILCGSFERRCVAHTRGADAAFSRTKSASTLVAIGPESGWTEGEIQVFQSHGFECVSLGRRMLRVEHALTKLII